jgi:hypothetical protein
MVRHTLSRQPHGGEAWRVQKNLRYGHFGLVIGFIGFSNVVTTKNYNAIVNSHILQFSTACTKSNFIFASRCLATETNNVLCQRSNIQSVPGGKVNILGGHSIGHSKQNMYTYMCLVPNVFWGRDRNISLHSSKFVGKKEILRTISNNGIYWSSDKVGTVYLV